MRVLYLSWTGLAEPLGRSQVLAYLKLLSANHEISLLTMEKSEDLADSQLMGTLQAICKEHGIEWKFRRYHRHPRLLARAFDFLVFLGRAIMEARRFRPQLVHGRAYIASFVASIVARTRSIPFIFDMRALWPEELVVSGRLRSGSFMHKMIVSIERRLLVRSAGIVSLTQAAVKHLTNLHPNIPPSKLVVIPTCADLTVFRPRQRAQPSSPSSIGSVGSITSGWFKLPWLMGFLAAARRADSGLRFTIVSRDDERAIRAAAAEVGLRENDIKTFACSPEDVPAALADLDVLVMFFVAGVSKLASCPTRMAEALATGIPIVTNEGVGDVAAVIRDNRVGVLVESDSCKAMHAAYLQLLELMKDPNLSHRCRSVAENLFSVESGAATYGKLYQSATTYTSQL